MKKTFDLNKMGLEPMNELEMQEADGGSIWGRLAILAGCILAFTGIGAGFGVALIVGGAIEDAI